MFGFVTLVIYFIVIINLFVHNLVKNLNFYYQFKNYKINETKLEKGLTIDEQLNHFMTLFVFICGRLGCSQEV